MTAWVLSQNAREHEGKYGSRIRNEAQAAAEMSRTPAVKRFLQQTVMDEFNGSGAGKLKHSLLWFADFVHYHCLEEEDEDEDSSEEEQEGEEEVEDNAPRPTEVLMRCTSHFAPGLSPTALGTQLDGYQLHMNPKCKSGYRHVLHDPWVNKKHPWRAKVGKQHLGSFGSPEEAAVAVAKHLGDEPVGGGEAEAEEVEMEDGRPTEVRASTCCLQPPRRTEICPSNAQLEGYKLKLSGSASSGYANVGKNTAGSGGRAWRALISDTCLGYFEKPEEAALAVAKYRAGQWAPTEPAGSTVRQTAEVVEEEDGALSSTPRNPRYCVVHPPRRRRPRRTRR